MAAPTLDDLRSMLAETTGVEANTVTLDSSFEDLGLESADAANFAAAVQRKYQVQMDAAELTQMKTVGDFYRAVVSRTAA
jgi:acyl carrier protein